MLLFGMHMLKGTSICWRLSKAGQLVGYEVVVGSQLIHHGENHQVIAAQNLTFPLCKPHIITWIAYLRICFLHDTSLSFDQFCKLNSCSLPSRSHHLSLTPPTSTINSRSFCQCNILMNPIPTHILQDRNTKSFRHSLYNYLCNT